MKTSAGNRRFLHNSKKSDEFKAYLKIILEE